MNIFNQADLSPFKIQISDHTIDSLEDASYSKLEFKVRKGIFEGRVFVYVPKANVPLPLDKRAIKKNLKEYLENLKHSESADRIKGDRQITVSVRPSPSPAQTSTEAASSIIKPPAPASSGIKNMGDLQHLLRLVAHPGYSEISIPDLEFLVNRLTPREIELCNRLADRSRKSPRMTDEEWQLISKFKTYAEKRF